MRHYQSERQLAEDGQILPDIERKSSRRESKERVSGKGEKRSDQKSEEHDKVSER